MRIIAKNDNIARIQFGVLGGDSIGAGTSGGEIKKELESIARQISEGSNRPKIMFGVANTPEQLQAEFARLVGTKPIQLNFGLGAPTATTKQNVKKYTEDLLGGLQKSATDVSSTFQKTFVATGKASILKQLGGDADKASAYIAQLNQSLETYKTLVYSLPKITEEMPLKDARRVWDAWYDQHWEDQVWVTDAKTKRPVLQQLEEIVNTKVPIDNAGYISIFNQLRDGMMSTADYADQLQSKLEFLQNPDIVASDFTELFSETTTQKLGGAVYEHLAGSVKESLNSINQELTANGAEPIDVAKLINFNPEELSAYISNALSNVMHEIEVADPNSGAAAALKFKADVSPEAQEELRASITELVNSISSEAFKIRVVADTSAESLSAFSESLNTFAQLNGEQAIGVAIKADTSAESLEAFTASLTAFSQLNGGQPIEVAITAGTSQETIDQLAASIRGVAEQVEGKEFSIRFAPAEGAIATLRQEVERGFDDAIGVRLDVRDQDGNSIASGSITQTTEAIKQHIASMQDAINIEKEKTQAANELTKALNAETSAMERAERSKSSGKPKQTEAEKEQARQEAQMWAEYEKQKTQEAKAYSEQRRRELEAAAKEQARIEREAAEEVAAANREAYAREEADFDRYARRHTAELKAKAQAEKDAAKAAEQAATARHKAAEKAANAAQKEAKQAESSALSYDKLTNKLTTYFHRFEREIQRSPELMAQYEQVLNNLNTQGFGTNMTNAAAAVQKFQIACEQAGVGANSFIKRIIAGFGNKLFYGGMAQAAAALRRLVMQIYANVKDLDAAMTQLQIVTGASDAQMEKFLTSSTQLARELGQSISDVMKSIETFSRLGYNLTDASELARYATVLSNVAAVDVGSATTGLTSIIKAFGMQVSDSEHVADVLVNVGQKYAISAEELMAAFERGGSALASTNTSFDKAAAIFAAANASMQNAEKVGTAIQTVSARIRGAKSELEELGGDYEDIAEGISKYRNELMALTNVSGTGGFDIMADVDTGKYKDIYDIFVGIAGVWNQLSDTSQARVAEILGGTRQLSVISSVIKNIADAEGALDVAQNSAGVALKANDKYLDSIQGRVGQLTADFQDLSQSILDSGLIKYGVSLLDVLVQLVDKAAEAKALLPGILAILTSINAVGRPEYEGFQLCAHLDFACEGYISELAA